MATTVLISGSNDRAKIRNPWGVLGLALVTLGVYTWFWWYYINREMRDLGRARGVSGLGDSPGLSCAAWILGGFFLIPLIWTIVTTTIRVARAQAVTNQPVLNGWLAASSGSSRSDSAGLSSRSTNSTRLGPANPRHRRQAVSLLATRT